MQIHLILNGILFNTFGCQSKTNRSFNAGEECPFLSFPIEQHVHGCPFTRKWPPLHLSHPHPGHDALPIQVMKRRRLWDSLWLRAICCCSKFPLPLFWFATIIPEQFIGLAERRSGLDRGGICGMVDYDLVALCCGDLVAQPKDQRPARTLPH